MTVERAQRRLAAVLSACVSGYGELMSAHEEDALVRLKSIRKAIIDPIIAAHRSRIVKDTGDRMLVEFASAVDAVRSAVEVQRGLAEQNAAAPPDRRIEFRIGIHVGDIIFDEDDIFGDSVNIAVRLESIADPGGICLSESACQEIRGKVDIGCDDLGPQPLKNIAEPFGCGGSSLALQGAATAQPVAPRPSPAGPTRRPRFPTSRRSPCCRSRT